MHMLRSTSALKYYLNPRQIQSKDSDIPPEETLSDNLPNDSFDPIDTPNNTPTPPDIPSESDTVPQISQGQTPVVAITAAVLSLIVGFVFAFYIIRHFYSQRKASEGKSLNIFKTLWPKSTFDSKSYRAARANEHLEPINGETDGDGPDSRPMVHRLNSSDRAASFRSVITLPPYMQTARQNEKVLGREGERAGIDTVVEFPNTAEEEEQRREEEMEALYQVRLARRRENEIREERRRMRREARERGDQLSPGDIEGERSLEGESGGQTIEELRAEHDRLKKQRQRAVSVVSYAEIGVARHDGTRLDSSGQEVEQIGLLGDAASISAASAQPLTNGRPGSFNSFCTMGSEVAHINNPATANSEAPRSPLSFSTDQDTTLSPFLPQSTRSSFSNPLFSSHIWSRPKENSKRASKISARSFSVGLEGRSISDQSSAPLSVPPRYRSLSLLSPELSSDLPPHYSRAESEENQQFPRTERYSNASDASRGTPESNNSINHSKNNSASSELHVRRSSRGTIPSLSNLKIDPLPSIQVDLASPMSVCEQAPRL